MVGEDPKLTFKVTEIGHLPKEWFISNLATSCHLITDGSHYSPSEFKNGTKLIATVHNMEENKIDVDHCKRISDRDYEMLVRNGCKPINGDVLFSKDGTVGICFPFNQENDLVLLSSIAILRLKGILDPTFVSQYMKSEFGKRQVSGLKTGTALSRITLEKLKRVKIPIPLLPEQQKISKILSDTDSLIESLDKLITKKKNIKQGLMQTLLRRGIGHTKFKKTEIGEIPEEWQIRSISETGKYVNGMAFKPSDWKKNGIPIVRIENLTDQISEFNYFQGKIDDKYLLKNGDILFSWSATLGVYLWNRGTAALNQHIFKVVPNETVIKGYLFWTLQMSIDKLNRVTHGSTMKHFQRGELERTLIPIPSLSEQERIDKIISDADNEIRSLEQKRDKYKLLKQGMMQQLLTGGIRVK